MQQIRNKSDRKNALAQHQWRTHVSQYCECNTSITPRRAHAHTIFAAKRQRYAIHKIPTVQSKICTARMRKMTKARPHNPAHEPLNSNAYGTALTCQYAVAPFVSTISYKISPVATSCRRNVSAVSFGATLRSCTLNMKYAKSSGVATRERTSSRGTSRPTDARWRKGVGRGFGHSKLGSLAKTSFRGQLSRANARRKPRNCRSGAISMNLGRGCGEGRGWVCVQKGPCERFRRRGGEREGGFKNGREVEPEGLDGGWICQRR